MHYTDDPIILEISFIQQRPKETRLALLRDINARVAAAAGVTPDDMVITLYEFQARTSLLAKARHSASMPFRVEERGEECLQAVWPASHYPARIT